ncbi:unnamed protein product [Paramecium octaurelia]|uniref:Transmembrane protein n=1 Tax=Paramecium octaurelia TaxID=43137 RepID=A0A8S1WCZ8_PAROT|nr:unnamed protein product [Paramecium octaurelia]
MELNKMCYTTNEVRCIRRNCVTDALGQNCDFHQNQFKIKKQQNLFFLNHLFIINNDRIMTIYQIVLLQKKRMQNQTCNMQCFCWIDVHQLIKLCMVQINTNKDNVLTLQFIIIITIFWYMGILRKLNGEWQQTPYVFEEILQGQYCEFASNKQRHFLIDICESVECKLNEITKLQNITRKTIFCQLQGKVCYNNR